MSRGRQPTHLHKYAIPWYLTSFPEQVSRTHTFDGGPPEVPSWYGVEGSGLQLLIQGNLGLPVTQSKRPTVPNTDRVALHRYDLVSNT